MGIRCGLIDARSRHLCFLVAALCAQPSRECSCSAVHDLFSFRVVSPHTPGHRVARYRSGMGQVAHT
eukprot:6162144-Alexandrium_andersonii.AAC.1